MFISESLGTSEEAGAGIDIAGIFCRSGDCTSERGAGVGVGVGVGELAGILCPSCCAYAGCEAKTSTATRDNNSRLVL